MQSGVRYSITTKRSGARELKRIPARDRSRILEAVDRLADDPMTGSPL